MAVADPADFRICRTRFVGERWQVATQWKAKIDYFTPVRRVGNGASVSHFTAAAMSL